MLVVALVQRSQVVGKRLDHDLCLSLVMPCQCLLDVFSVQVERFLKQLDVVRLSSGYQHVREGLESQLFDCFAVVEGHVSDNQRKQRLNIRRECGPHVL